MQWKGDSSFINLLNKFRIVEVDHNVEPFFRSKFLNKNADTSYPADYVHIFAKNKPVEEDSRLRLNEIDNPLFCIIATEKVSPELKLSQNQSESINAKKISDTGNLSARLQLKNICDLNTKF